jgi:hypothetical protein
MPLHVHKALSDADQNLLGWPSQSKIMPLFSSLFLPSV